MVVTLDNEWPASLPLPLIDYSGVPKNQTLVTPEITHHIARRSRFTRSYCILSVGWTFNDDQLATFNDFLTSLGNGTAQFKIELRFPKNTGLTEWAVRIEDGYQVTYDDGIWKVTSNLELVSLIDLG